MAYPNIYSVTYSYTGFQMSQGNSSFPGTQLDADLAGLTSDVTNIAQFVKGVMRSDGALNNGLVTYDSLAPQLQTAGLAPATAWQTATSYLVGNSVIINSSLYRCLVAHTSGVFATDLAAADWLLVSVLAGPAGAAGAGYGGTSATSLVIANGVTKVFQTQAGMAYQVGNFVRASSAASGANFMEGFISAYSGTSMSIAVSNAGGAGTFASWVLSLSVPSPVSQAMLPVVNATTLALAHTAFGLGGAGTGLQDDGNGNIRVNNPVVAVSTNQAVVAGFELERFIATGPINFTFPRSNTLWNGFGFWIEAVTGDSTLLIDSHDTFSGNLAAGTSLTVPAGAKIFVTTDGAGNWYHEGLPWLVPLARSTSGAYAVSASDMAKILAFNDGTKQVIGFPAANTLPSKFRCLIVNSDLTLVGKRVSGIGADFIMYPGQAYTVEMVAGVLTIPGGLERWVLEQATTFYVDPAAGGSFNDGLAPGAARAFASPQIGIDAICNNLDVNRQNVVLQFADGTYSIPIHLYPVTGWGTIGGHSELIVQGDMTTPGNCIVSVSNSNCFSMVGLTTPWRIQGFHMTVTSGTGNCVSVDGGSFCYIGAANEFGACPNSHISVSYKSFVESVGGSYSIVGSAANHINANVSSLADMVGTQITFVGSITFSNSFVTAQELCDVTFQTCSFVGSFTGQRYSSILNSVVNTGGGGSGFFPGTIAGTTGTGGQYG